MELGIYLHIPFCKSKCYYCDFASYPLAKDKYSSYVEALVKEIKAYGDSNNKPATIKTIFIGGGTPSVLPPILLEKILFAIEDNLNIDKKAEYTIEANPGTLSNDKIKIMKKYKINRVSMGAQSYNNKLLKTIGRCHSEEDIIKSFYMLREAGFTNINLDLMFALPGQSLKDLEKSLAKTAKLKPEHISAYSLIIEEGTPFGDLYKKGKLKLVDEDVERSMYYLIKDYLKQYGYSQYEISNFSKEGKESRHNINNWKTNPYIGIGLGAHSYYNGYRYNNTYDMDKYIANSNKLDLIQEDRSYVSQKAQMEEFMFLGLRLTKGIDIKDFYKRFNKSIYEVYGKEINKHIENKLLEEGKGRIWLTDYGQDLSNLVLCSFLLD